MFYLIFLLFFLHPSSLFAIEQNNSVTISAAIDVNQVTINGYTSPKSKVELTSIGVYDQTYSREDGFFEFDRTVLPKNYSELCLSSVDIGNRHTTPVCIPPPPRTNYHTNIGPIILPPTITIDNTTIKPGETVITSGQAIPNSTVEVYFYQTKDHAQTFPKTASAYSLPVFSTTTDKDGDFSLNLPTAYSSDYRLYAATKYQENLSPKSNTLLYVLPSLWWLFFQQNYHLIISLTIFFINLLVFILLIFFSHKSKKFNSPSLYPEHLLRSTYIPE